jgi:hypothetical protein
MSAVQIVERLLLDAPKVTNSIGIGTIAQPVEPPFIVLSHVYEAQDTLLQSAVEHYDTRVSVEIIARDAIACDRQAEAVKTCLGYVVHQTVGSGTRRWTDVCILKAGGDIYDYDDAKTVYRRVVDFNVRWKPYL